MERITGKQVQSMMEALHQVYVQPEEQVENLQEEVSDIEEQRLSGPQRRARQQAASADAAAVKDAELKAGGGQAAVQSQLKQRYGGRMPSQRQLARHSSGASATRSVAATGRENLYRGGGGDAAMAKGLTRQQVMAQGAKNIAAKPTAAAPTKPVASDTKPTTPAGATAADTKPAVPTGTVNGQKFERRLPTMAELRAAQAARKAAAAAGKDKAGQETAAVKGGVSVSQRKPATTPPPVSADKPASAPAANTAKPAAASTPAAKPAMTAAGNKAAELAALRAKAKADTMKKSKLGEEAELDVFDTIKEYLIGEGATEEEALKQMLTLTDEQRTEIIEGSCSSKKKKSKKGGY